ncbi:MAG: hypothetical protein R6V56_07485 [Lentisphaeria bacterium]
MEQRIVSFTIDEIAVDTDNVLDSLNEACTKRHLHYWVRGICKIEDRVYFMLLPVSEGQAAETYRFVEGEEMGDGDFVAEVNSRYQGGFDMVGSFKVYDTLMLVFATGRK